MGWEYESVIDDNQASFWLSEMGSRAEREGLLSSILESPFVRSGHWQSIKHGESLVPSACFHINVTLRSIRIEPELTPWSNTLQCADTQVN